MTVAWTIKGLLAALLLPPGNGLALLGLAALYRRRHWAFGLAMFGGLLLLLQSLPMDLNSAMSWIIIARVAGVLDIDISKNPAGRCDLAISEGSIPS